MKGLNAPLYNARDVYKKCVDSITTDDLRDRLRGIKNDIGLAADDYEDKAKQAKLFQIKRFTGKPDTVVLGGVSKDELGKVYDQHMVGPKKPARRIYDELKLGAPLNICPYCGFGHVSTLDHYLPKAKYPCLTVLPINLVPSCSDCNKGKTARVAVTPGQQCIHPYFDHYLCSSDQWLFADVIETTPVSIKYYVSPPAGWGIVNKDRVQTHFSDFNLSTRYAIQATNELATLKELLVYYFDEDGADGVRQELQRRSNVAFRVHLNAWNSALFQTLAANDWYCSGGFRAE